MASCCGCRQQLVTHKSCMVIAWHHLQLTRFLQHGVLQHLCQLMPRLQRPILLLLLSLLLLVLLLLLWLHQH
jgi:hypothetical protein